MVCMVCTRYDSSTHSYGLRKGTIDETKKHIDTIKRVRRNLFLGLSSLQEIDAIINIQNISLVLLPVAYTTITTVIPVLQ